ncbi:Two-component sensor histidine kinase [Labilithrix luteola]|uniref:histidine kinase n=1 Tax=Labilithrix luteola TaxID=1391654 RepID=A0A0K1QA33_9BACT|nr:Two-component sensor histidine kinase [Labilithrix luteola]
MVATPSPSAVWWCTFASRVAALLSGGIAIRVLATWLSVGPAGLRPSGGYTMLSPIEAGAIFALVVSLLFGCASPTARSASIYTSIHRATALFALTLGVGMLIELIFGVDLGLGRWPLPRGVCVDVAACPGLSVNTPMSIVLVAAALLALETTTSSGRRPADWLVAAVGFGALVVLTGYVYGTASLYALPDGRPEAAMSLHSAVCFVLLSAGVLCARTQTGFMGLVTSDLLGGTVARRFLLMAWLVPIFGAVAVFGQRAGVYKTPLTASLIAIAGMLGVVALVFATARTLDRADRDRRWALRELERWKALFDNAEWGVMRVDRSGKIRLANPAYARMHGLTPEELAHRNAKDLMAPSRRNAYEPRFDEVVARGHLRFESEHVHDDGTRFPVVIDATAVRDDDGAWSCVSYVQDVTDWRAAERAQAHLAAVVEASEDAIVSYSLGGVVLTWNRAAERVYGWTAEEAMAATRMDPIGPWIPPDRRIELNTLMRDIEHGKAVAVLETKRVRKDGTKFDAMLSISPIFDARGDVTAFSVTTRDVTGRKRAEEALARGHAMEKELRHRMEHLYEEESVERLRLQATLDQMPDGVIVVDADGHLVAKNRAVEALSSDFATGEGAPEAAVAIDLRHPTGEPFDKEDLPLVRLLRLGAATRAEEAVVVLRDGRQVPVLVSAGEVRGPKGTLIGAVETLQDITTIKELERLREEWASVVAHDLRQPLHTISLNLHLLGRHLGERASESPVDTRSLDRIGAAVHRLDRMIRDLSDVSRLEARRLTLQLQPTDLAVLVADVVDRFSASGERVAFRFESRGTACSVSADADRIDQVLTNLMTNAVKYGDGVSPIVVSVDWRETEVVVSIKNRGAGVTQEDKERIFSRFERSRRAGTSGVRGLGLGLYISRGLVEAHGGRVEVESVPGEETTFRFTLPIANDQAAR